MLASQLRLPFEPLAEVPRALGLPQCGQVGYVVDDVGEACRHHGPSLGIARWYRAVIRRQQLVADGAPLAQQFEIAIGYAGGVQIEVLSVTGGGGAFATQPAETQEFQPHHVAVFIDDVRREEARLNALGYRTLQSGWFSFAPRSKTRIAYLDTAPAHGIIVELIENRYLGFAIGMPEWYVRLGAAAGFVHRLE